MTTASKVRFISRSKAIVCSGQDSARFTDVCDLLLFKYSNVMVLNLALLALDVDHHKVHMHALHLSKRAAIFLVSSNKKYCVRKQEKITIDAQLFKNHNKIFNVISYNVILNSLRNQKSFPSRIFDYEAYERYVFPIFPWLLHAGIFSLLMMYTRLVKLIFIFPVFQCVS